MFHSNSVPNSVMTMKIVKDNIFNEETRIKEYGISSCSKALVTKTQGRSKRINLTIIKVVIGQEEGQLHKKL